MSVLIYPTEWRISNDYKTVIITGYNYTNDRVLCKIPFRPYRIISTYHNKESFSLISDLIISKNNNSDKNIFLIFAWDKDSLDEISNVIEDVVEFIDIDMPMLSLFFNYNNINPGRWLLVSEINADFNDKNYKYSFIGKTIRNDFSKDPLYNVIGSTEKYKTISTWMIPGNELDGTDDINKKINYIRVWYNLYTMVRPFGEISIKPINGLYINFTKEDITEKLVVVLSRNDAVNKKLINDLNYTNSDLYHLAESGYLDVDVRKIGRNIQESFTNVVNISQGEVWINDDLGNNRCIINNGDVCEPNKYTGIGQLINPKFTLIQIYMYHILNDSNIPESTNLSDLVINELITQDMMYTEQSPVMNMIREHGIQIEEPTIVYYYMCMNGPVLLENFSVNKDKINYEWYDNEIKRILYI